MSAWYGAIVGGPSKSPYSTGRKILNIWALVWLLLLPLLTFGGLFGLMSFSVRSNSPWVIWLLAGLLLLLCLYLGYMTFDAYRKWKYGDPNDPNSVPGDPNAFKAFLLLGLILLSVFGALVLALAFGEMNFQQNSSPYSQLTTMRSYNDVTPGSGPGQLSGAQLMDAGRLTFAPGTHVDVTSGSGFKDHKTYCVAPIVGPDNKTLGSSYDLWAVGIDCCVPRPGASYWCPEALEPTAVGAVRLTNDHDRAFYRMAVQQVEAAWTIKATHPLFFLWVQDPYEHTDSMHANAVQFFLIGLGAFLIWQLFLVACAAFYFLRHENDPDEPAKLPPTAVPPAPAPEPMPQRRRGHWEWVED